MRFSIKHLSDYIYSDLVFLEPQHLYFYPSARNYLKLHHFNINISQDTVGLSLRSDAEGNFYHQVWFKNTFDRLSIETEIEIETIAINPFDFLTEPELISNQKEILDVYLKIIPINEQVKNWVDKTSSEAGDDLLTFSTYLNKEIKANWGHEANYLSGLMTADECFKSDNASCRDLAWMMISMLRYKHIPARFVSGYAFNPELAEGHELHAWVEIWFNGAGWVGIDPSSGVLATHNHIPVAVSYHPSNTLPVQGNFRGNATSKLMTEVVISQI